jgi:CMP-N-acetylneuraminic acid synthetase
MKTLGIIPARGGSKAVPRKNIRLVGRKPLIEYSIDAAKGSRLLSRFVVSTDDEEIAVVARKCGCDVIIRPPELAADDTPMAPVALHALRILQSQGEEFDATAILQPTAPLRTSDDIDLALDLLAQGDCDSVVSVYQVSDQHPARMYKLISGYLMPYEQEPANRLRQYLPPVYHRNGAVYVCINKLLEEKGVLLGTAIKPYIMSKERSLNIDEELDLAFADWFLSQYGGNL